MRYFNARTTSIARWSAPWARSTALAARRLTFTAGLSEIRRALHGKSHHGGTPHGDGNGENHGSGKPDRRQKTMAHRARDPTSSMARGTDTERSLGTVACRPAAASRAYSA